MILGAIAASGYAFQRIEVARDRDRFPPPGHLVSIGDRRLHIRCVGRGTPVVVILSGGGTPAVTSFDVQDRVGRFTRVCAYDRAGLGWSDPAPRPQTFADLGADFEILMRRTNEPGPYVLVPESFGGLIALDIIGKMPGQVAGAVFVDASEPGQWFDLMPTEGENWRRHELWWRPAVAFGAVRALFDQAAPAWVRALPTERRRQMRALYARSSLGYRESFLAAAVTPVAERPSVIAGGLNGKPVAVLVHGLSDGMLTLGWEPGWPAAQRRLATIATGSLVTVVPGCGHAMAGECPGAVAAAVRQVVDEVKQRQSPELANVVATRVG